MSSPARPVVKYGRRNLKSRNDATVAYNDSSDNDSTTTFNRNIDKDANDLIPRKKRRLTRTSPQSESHEPSDDARLPLKDAKEGAHLPPLKARPLSKRKTIAYDSQFHHSARSSPTLEATTKVEWSTTPPSIQRSPIPSPDDVFSSPLSSLPRTPSPVKRDVARKMLKRTSTSSPSKHDAALESSNSFSSSGVAVTKSSPVTSNFPGNTNGNDFFSFISKSAGSSPIKQQGRGVSKRMLSRSRTDPVLSSSGLGTPGSSTREVEPRPLGPSVTLPIGAEDLKDDAAVFSVSSTISIPTEQQTIARPALSHKHTYANSRSFLVPIAKLPITARNGLKVVKDEEYEGMDPGQLGDSAALRRDDLDEELHRESYTELKSKWGIDASDEMDGTEAEAVVLKSITEMRSKGESRRFLDEMGWLYEGLDIESDNSQAVQRNSAIEILSKMCDMDFMRRAKAADFVNRTWEMICLARGESDLVFEPCLAFFACLIAREPHALQELAFASESMTKKTKTSLAVVLCDCLEKTYQTDSLKRLESESLLKGKGKLQKAELKSLNQLKGVIQRSGILNEGSKPTSSLLASAALKSLQPSHQTKHILKILSAVEMALRRSLSELLDIINALQGDSDDLADDAFAGNQEHIANCTAMLDDYLSGKWGGESLKHAGDAESLNYLSDRDKMTTVRGILALCMKECWVRENGTEHDSQLTHSALRVLVNLTNGSESWCSAFQSITKDDGRASAIQNLLSLLQWSYREYLPIAEEDKNLSVDEESRAAALDRFCLTLGILTNVVRVVGVTRDTTRTSRVSPTCQPRLSCIRRCTCEHAIPGVNFLVLLYANHASRLSQMDKATVEDIFLAGHLAMLLVLLCVDNAENERVLLQALPGSKDEQLSDLINHVESFTMSYQRVVSHLSQSLHDGATNPTHSIDVLDDNVMHQVTILLSSMRERLEQQFSD